MNNIDSYISLIEKTLGSYIPETSGELSAVKDMLSYSLDGGGKRIRPLLCLEFCRAAGGDVTKALGFACAVEFVHTYSLIHDDLPCMDNDDFRRGKPSSHKKFGEANALLAGDALLTLAFGIIADSAENGDVTPLQAVRAVKTLSAFAGPEGMIGGQYIDLAFENRECGAGTLFMMDKLKTSALISSACELGLVAAGADEEKTGAAREFAENLGLAFQITDDILECSDTVPSSDEINNKSTYVSVFGLQKAKELADAYTRRAVDALGVFGNEADEIKEIAAMLLNRKK